MVSAAISGSFIAALEPIEAISVSYRGTAAADKVRLDSTSQKTAETLQ
jgi:hypothetical protein